jgi:hypothetical protein
VRWLAAAMISGRSVHPSDPFGSREEGKGRDSAARALRQAFTEGR